MGLDTLELQPEDAWAFFRLVDTDVSGNLDASEFVKGCLHLRGTARSIDLYKTMYDQKMMRRQNQAFMKYVSEQFNEIAVLLRPPPKRAGHFNAESAPLSSQERQESRQES